MMDFGCHRLEVLTNLFGTAKRTASLVSNEIFKREVEDTAAVSLQFENGTCAALIVTHAAREAQDTLDIFGTEGSIQVPVLNKAELKIKTENGERCENHPPHRNAHQPLIEDFTESVLHNRQPRINGATGKQIAEITEKIYRSDR